MSRNCFQSDQGSICFAESKRTYDVWTVLKSTAAPSDTKKPPTEEIGGNASRMEAVVRLREDTGNLARIA